MTVMLRRAWLIVDQSRRPGDQTSTTAVSACHLVGIRERMSRSSVLLAALTNEPVSTSELYDRVGYLALARAGLIPYSAFRSELETLAAAGLAISATGEDGSTLWRAAPTPRAPM
jgi:hypothetical protein